jgi:hypothetical protein
MSMFRTKLTVCLLFIGGLTVSPFVARKVDEWFFSGKPPAIEVRIILSPDSR